jgi:hypothetical protein
MRYPSLPAIRPFDADTAYHIFSTYFWPFVVLIIWAKRRLIGSFIIAHKFTFAFYTSLSACVIISITLAQFVSTTSSLYWSVVGVNIAVSLLSCQIIALLHDGILSAETLRTLTKRINPPKHQTGPNLT